MVAAALVASPAAAVESPPDPALDRVRSARGALIAHFQVSAPGQLELRAILRTRNGTAPACATMTSTLTAGPISVRCPLSRAVRRRLEARWLRLYLDARLVSPPAAPAEVTAAVGLRRTAAS